LARIQRNDGSVVEIRSPLPGRIDKVVKPIGSQVTQDEEVLRLHSDEDSVWEALRALALVGKAEDLPLVESVASGEASQQIREQASLTIQAIQRRAK
jgi:hypothetical protein